MVGHLSIYTEGEEATIGLTCVGLGPPLRAALRAAKALSRFALLLIIVVRSDLPWSFVGSSKLSNVNPVCAGVKKWKCWLLCMDGWMEGWGAR